MKTPHIAALSLALLGAGLTSASATTVGQVLCDANGNGIIDSGDTPVPGVMVVITNISGTFSNFAWTGTPDGYFVMALGGPDTYVEYIHPLTLPAGATVISPPGGVYQFTTTDANPEFEGSFLLNNAACHPGAPALQLFKTADHLLVQPGGAVTYTYTVTNSGSITISNITVVDDNGTPGDTSDDVVVGTIDSLDAGASQTFTFSFTITGNSPQQLCADVGDHGGQNMPVGTLQTQVLPSGDVQVTFSQYNVNDNRYGTGATPATGWSHDHKFNDLVGSDKAEFQFTDGAGNVVLDFDLDYISKASGASFPSGSVSYPSGYGTLGVTGGDGKMIKGNASSVLFADTSLTENLRQAQFQSGYLVNSPPETSPNSGVSVPAGWDYINSYTVVVSKNAFGAAGFGSVSIPYVHNSPSKMGKGAITPTPCGGGGGGCVVNVAVATGTAGGAPVMAQASAQVCLTTGIISPGLQLIKTADNVLVQPGATVTYTYTVTNTGSMTVSNITVVDDNGTPSDTSDDVVVGALDTLGVGESQSFMFAFTLTNGSPQQLCEDLGDHGGQNMPVGTLQTQVLPSGDVQVTFSQYNVNDNRYGTGATPATGWSHDHKFNDLVGSDKAEFQFTDGAGNVVLDFDLDYISKASGASFPSGSVSYPSGYGTLGVTGGDGKMIKGNASSVLFADTSLTENLRQAQFQSGYLVNSPAETSPNSGVSVPAGWDYINSYTVVVSKNAFGAAGFGSVSIPYVHNSPSKKGKGAITPTPCGGCIVNVAVASGTAAGAPVTAQASAQVCFATGPGCSLLSACTPPYPFRSSNPLTSLDFSESDVLRTAVVSVVTGCIPDTIQVFYSDEHALLLGIRQVQVNGPGGGTTDYPVTPLSSNPGSALNPQVGSMLTTGDQAGADLSGRPIYPALFITDVTDSTDNPYAGDWQYGGTPIPPDAVFGTWKAAVKVVGKAHGKPKKPKKDQVSINPDRDPKKNGWDLGPGSDPVPSGLKNEGFGAEVRWDISKLGLVSGHTYRLYFMVHDGDQNKKGGDAGQGCAILNMP